MNSDYVQIFDDIFKPTLIGLGFKKVVLNGCMAYEVLYRKDDLWIGSSWDFRDQYLEFSIGHMYSFKDVMPRFIILGDYSDYCGLVNELQPYTSNYRAKYLELALNNLTESLAIYESDYGSIKAKYINSRRKYSSEYMHLLGKPVNSNTLAAYET
jgi:hypothetical protein|tara:strand:+ start:60 stop:524 length:465 start_codon:yes stop_codon:yes gene_type:complete